MRYLLAAILLSAQAQADTGIDAVTIFSNGLGYESTGYGVQIDTDGRQGNWGWDAQVTALRHGKRHAEGNRFRVIGMGRRFFCNHFIELGAEYGGYKSKFTDGTTWRKYGYSPAVGIGTTHKGTEWTLRYFAPDSTPNDTSVVALSGEVPIGNWAIGATVERWRYDQSGRQSGTQIMFEFGRRF